MTGCNYSRAFDKFHLHIAAFMPFKQSLHVCLQCSLTSKPTFFTHAVHLVNVNNVVSFKQSFYVSLFCGLTCFNHVVTDFKSMHKKETWAYI